MGKKKRTSRRPKTHRVARTRAGGEWSESGYWGFIRSLLRAGARRYPPIVRQALERQRRPSQRGDRTKWEYQCEKCNEWFARKEVQVDHIVPCGELTDYAHCGDFIQRMFCEPDGLQVLCTGKCHATKTKGKKVDPNQLWLDAISGDSSSDGPPDSDELETPG